LTTRRVLAAATGLALLGCTYGAGPDQRVDFVLVFQNSTTALDPAASAIVDRAVRAARAAPDLDVTVAGYADPSLTPESNQILSRIRAQTVADALVQRGVPRSRVQLTPRRAIGADPGIESRRVDIRVGA